MTSQIRFRALVLLVGSLLFLSAFGCSRSDKIPIELENQLRSGGVKDINVDFSFQSPDIPNKKYIALTAIYNFSTADGSPQKEYLGYILKQENNNWKVDRNAAYTKSDSKAKDLLEGKK